MMDPAASLALFTSSPFTAPLLILFVRIVLRSHSTALCALRFILHSRVLTLF